MGPARYQTGKAVITSGAAHLNLDPRTGRGSCGNEPHLFPHPSPSPLILHSIAIWTAGLVYGFYPRPGRGIRHGETARSRVLVGNAASQPWSARKRPCHSLSAPQIGLERRSGSQSKSVCVVCLLPVQRVVPHQVVCWAFCGRSSLVVGTFHICRHLGCEDVVSFTTCIVTHTRDTP